MSGKNPRLTPLELQKQLLLAESELNRAQLLQNWQRMGDDAHALVNQARTLRLLASAASVLINGVASLRRKKSAPADEKPSWCKTIFKGAHLVSSLWEQFRSTGRD